MDVGIVGSCSLLTFCCTLCLLLAAAGYQNSYDFAKIKDIKDANELKLPLKGIPANVSSCSGNLCYK